MQLQNMLRFRMAWSSPSGPHASVVLSSRIRLARNLAEFPFPWRAGPRARTAVLQAAFAASRKTRALGAGAYLRLEAFEPLERVFLAERRIISAQMAAEPGQSGAVIGGRELLSLMVNEEDHLRLQALDSGLSLISLWGKALELEGELSRELRFAHHAHWGYLTACPTNTGTAMRASVLAHLPALGLSGRINDTLRRLSGFGLAVRGLYGEGTRVLGDFYQISNASALGRSETAIIETIARAIEALAKRELETQRSMAGGPDAWRLEDRVYRSIGILAHARTISYEETLQHCSHARMALNLGWKIPVNLDALNELLVLAQPAHLQMAAGKELAPQERDAMRAALLRHRFKA